MSWLWREGPARFLATHDPLWSFALETGKSRTAPGSQEHRGRIQTQAERRRQHQTLDAQPRLLVGASCKFMHLAFAGQGDEDSHPPAQPKRAPGEQPFVLLPRRHRFVDRQDRVQELADHPVCEQNNQTVKNSATILSDNVEIGPLATMPPRCMA
jgi:hypothetical protein